MWVYNEAAAKWGGVNPDDEDAVEDFFVYTIKTLSHATREEVMRFLLSHDGMSMKKPDGPYTPPDPLGVMKDKL